ncbi:MAG: response regulator [Planctomycetota bacterium]|jgi:CheY-like chemotaxis protein|nr:response regulator [Planctomycetota bacterium]
MNWFAHLKTHLVKVLLLVACFAAITAGVLWATTRMLERELAANVEHSLQISESRLQDCLQTAESAIVVVALALEDRLQNGAFDSAALGDYLAKVSAEFNAANNPAFVRVYALLNGELLNAPAGLPADFLPVRSPWYQLAIRLRGAAGITLPYRDAVSGEMCVSVARELRAADRAVGVVALDINPHWFAAAIDTIGDSADRHGMVLDPYLEVYSYAYAGTTGKNLREIGGSYAAVYDDLLAHQEVFGRRVIGIDGEPRVLFFRELPNGWRVGAVVLERVYYAAPRRIALMVVACGIVGTLLVLRAEHSAKGAAENLRAKDLFLARVSHELRTPLNVVLGMNEMAQRETPTKTPAYEYQKQVRAAAQNLLYLINDLVSFSKIHSDKSGKSGRWQAVADPYDIAMLFADLLTAVSARAAEAKITFTAACAPDFPRRFKGDSARVQQIAAALLDNAVKFTSAGGAVKFTARVAERLNNAARLAFVVEDSGRGIKKRDLPHLFEGFYRAADLRSQTVVGIGLGLHLARTACRALKGDIAVVSEFGKGSTFTATLTQTVADWSPLGEWQATAEEEETAAFIAPRAQVLAVDDLNMNLMVLEGLLKIYRLVVTTCLSGAEAVKLAGERPFDLIFMDQMMPEMDGLAAAAKIRALPDQAGKVPIIALTANTVMGAREMFLASGFDDFMCKPVDPDKLDEILRRWLPADKQIQKRTT